MIDSRTAPYAALVLRVTLGALFLAHAGLKLLVFTPAGTAKFFGSLGFPPELAYLVISVEVLSGIALILGVWTRWAAIAGIPILLGAIFTVHGAAGFFFTNPKGGWEYPAFWAIALVAQALLGDGAFALRPSRDVEAASGQLSAAPSR
ncbi:DoxX family protein [Bradyrhizobium manausense]|uniref:DoxX family protein n=1 Tax=Bradyrhizobium manausense TaxID=989370 RepID=UPI001BA51F5F|nr:DoxX family protein [Bradyrhizobium manausense]MBR0791816.1 DoxX family protein [Bradyrhizobium manausense]